MSVLPFVTVIVPCRNEGRFIAQCLDSIIHNDYPADRLEVLVVDGMSEDGTWGVICEFSRKYPTLKTFRNPKKITPAALNIGIKNAIGGIIIRVDARTRLEKGHIKRYVQILDGRAADARGNGADVIGGPLLTRPGAQTLVARTIALATAHPFGVGNSRFRTSLRAGYTDTVPFGAYRREVFDKVGLFDERLVRNQDNELCSRIIRAGGKIFMAPELACEYSNQPTLKRLLEQNFRSGMWNVLTVRIAPSAFRWRHFVPFLFVTMLFLLASLAIVRSWARPALLLLVFGYASLALLSSLQIGLRTQMKNAMLLPPVFFLLHLVYGLGTWLGAVRLAFTGWGRCQ